MPLKHAARAGLAVTLVSLSSCGLLIGNTKPVAEKSDSYRIADLSERAPEWKKLPQEAPDPDEGPTVDTSDVAFQSQKTASIISLNSACRPSFETEGKDLRGFTNLLFLGISDVTHRNEKELQVEGFPALETTLQGKLNQENMKLRTVVVRRGTCVYDLMYVARPEHFPDNEPDFAHFVASLKLR